MRFEEPTRYATKRLHKNRSEARLCDSGERKQVSVAGHTLDCPRSLRAAAPNFSVVAGQIGDHNNNLSHDAEAMIVGDFLTALCLGVHV